MDLDEWVSYLRLLIRKYLDNQRDSKVLLVKLVKYIRFVERISSYKQIANSKLSKYLTVMSIPRGLDPLA